MILLKQSLIVQKNNKDFKDIKEELEELRSLVFFIKKCLSPYQGYIFG